MGNEFYYYGALKRLSSNLYGSAIFEKIVHILIKYLYPEYDFMVPEGGQGTRDGGYDGRDLMRKAKLACSLQEDYKTKIRNEIEISMKNGDSQLFFFSNQVIPEPVKIGIENNYKHTGTSLFIFGIDHLAQILDNYFETQYSPELYDLLDMSAEKAGYSYNRSDVIPLNIFYNGNLYKKRIIVNDNRNYSFNIYANDRVSVNPLLDFILNWCSEKTADYYEHITLCGIAYLGKTFLMKKTFNALLEEFINRNNYAKYHFIPFIQFYELKYYEHGIISNKIKNKIQPLLFFLDGLDELNETSKIYLNNELQSILIDNKSVHFIISGRNSSFLSLDIQDKAIQLYLEKYIDNNDTELINLIKEYNGTPIEDLLPIPTYRNFVLEKRISKTAKLDEFYTLLIQNSLLEDIKRNDYSKHITKRQISDINMDDINIELSEFCYKLFLTNNMIFSENVLKEHFINNNHFVFVLSSSIIDYQDINKISFTSNFYYEYFVANALLRKDNKIIIHSFFDHEKLKMEIIDILVIFLNSAKTKSKEIYRYLMKKIRKYNIACILISEFDFIPDSNRYRYFLSIFRKYKEEKKLIYYLRLNQSFGPLKNISNMAQRMQQLLPNNFKLTAVKYLKKEILKYLLNPTKNDISSFCNAVILLYPFINELWTENEQKVLKKISLPLIKFFLNNNYSSELNGLLSEKFIFNWYDMFNWTIDWNQKNWELFYEDISGCKCNLLSEISDKSEFTIKFNIFENFYKCDCIKPLIIPILQYAMKYLYIGRNTMACFVSDIVTEENQTPVVRTDSRIYELSNFLEEIELSITSILDLLDFAIKNNIYYEIKDSYDNPITILEEKLFNNISIIDSKDYKTFSDYYFNSEEYGFNDKLFHLNKTEEIDNLKYYLVNEVIDKEIKIWGTDLFLYNLLDLKNKERSIILLYSIKEKMPHHIYKEIIYCIYNDPNHILNNIEFVINEYNILFKDEILKMNKKKEKLDKIKIEMEIVSNNDLILIQDNNKMINELCKINNYLVNQNKNNDKKTKIHKIYELRHEAIKRIILYDNIDCEIPIFSECAIKIMFEFYRKNTTDIDAIIEELNKYIFDSKHFYIYFYWYYIEKTQNDDNKDIENITITDTCLINKIIDSMNEDLYELFTNKPQTYFEYPIYQWFVPFIYYCEKFLNKSLPTWMQPDHMLKLIVSPNPYNNRYIRISTDVSLDWLMDKLPSIKPDHIVENGLRIIDSIIDSFSKLQIVKYFYDYYNSHKQNKLTDGIMDFMIITTKKLFNTTEINHKYLEFQYIGQFWIECNLNYIDRLFPNFKLHYIFSAMRKNNEDVDYQYRKNVLLYCGRNATNEQKNRIINEIEVDMSNKSLSINEEEEIHEFLASLGREESIKLVIDSYLRGEAKLHRFSLNNYPIGIINQNDNLLNYFIILFFYSNEKITECRSILLQIAQDGIRKHLNKKNFRILERSIKKELKKQNNQSIWKTEFYSEFLLEMERVVQRPLI